MVLNAIIFIFFVVISYTALRPTLLKANLFEKVDSTKKQERRI